MNLQLEERRVLMEGEREKAVGVLVREKDVLSRANFKLLQLVELKEEAVKSILKHIESQGEEKIELKVELGGDREMEALMGAGTKERLREPRERVKVLSEWLRRQ